jgi:hypothetical protein
MLLPFFSPLLADVNDKLRKRFLKNLLSRIILHDTIHHLSDGKQHVAYEELYLLIDILAYF